VTTFDAALGVVCGDAEVLVARSAGKTLRVGTGTAYHRDDQISHREAVCRWANLDHLTQRLVPDDEVV
jgi:hypothetical protein